MNIHCHTPHDYEQKTVFHIVPMLALYDVNYIDLSVSLHQTSAISSSHPDPSSQLLSHYTGQCLVLSLISEVDPPPLHVISACGERLWRGRPSSAPPALCPSIVCSLPGPASALVPHPRPGHLLPWVLPVYSLLTVWVLPVYGLFTVWVLTVYGVFAVWVLPVYGVFTVWVLTVYGVFAVWVLPVYSLFTVWVLPVYGVFAVWVLPVYGVCLLSGF